MSVRGAHTGKRSVEIRVVALSGSLRAGSYTTMALRAALEGAASVSAKPRLLDLREFHLEFAGTSLASVSPGVAELKAEVKSAHGIVLGTPEYHGSFSGILKNALDLMGFEEFEGKM